MVLNAERSHAQMYDVTGRAFNQTQHTYDLSIQAMVINEDYQMIDAHIDEGIRKKIQAFEFIDFGKLLSKNCPMRDEEGQRLEIVNKNGMSFLSPVGDRESITINHYGKWEQAFRVYSNILTSKYPGKSTELLQYNHTIHTAS